MISADVPARSVASTTPSAAALRAVTPEDAPFERGDRFKGHYWCSQGRTELTLVIEDVDAETIAALFEFDYPGGVSHQPAAGSYRMHGAFDARTRTLRLKGDRWVEQPDGYVMVDLVGTMSKSGSLSGRIEGPGCSTFYLDGAKRARNATK